jgi:hypothetical protein
MNYTVTKTENYHLVKLNANALADGDITQLATECEKLLKSVPYLVFNCKEIASLDNSSEAFFIEMNASAHKAGGSIVLTELESDLADKMEEAGINCIPTDDEATDFIFLEQIESEFDDEEE